MAMLIKPKSNTNTKILPLVTLREGVVFPHTDSILSFARKSSIDGVKEAARVDGSIVIATQKSSKTESPSKKDIYEVATICKIEKTVPVNDEIHAIVRGIERVKIYEVTLVGGILSATVEPLDETGSETTEVKALVNHLVTLVKKAVNLGKGNIDVPVFMRLVGTSSPRFVSDQVASILDIKTKQKQLLLEETNLEKRLNKVIKFLNDEIKVLELEHKIASKTQKKFDQSMKEAVLRERMKMIQKELGDDEENEIAELRKKIRLAKMPKDAEKKTIKELRRLEKLSIHSPESGYIRTWIETMTEIPWSKLSKDEISLNKAEEELKKDHYGLKEVKERIIEYLAVMKLKKDRGTGKSKKESAVPTIICFVGPPGVGKTSVGRSIANAIGRKFVRLSLGGIHDEAQIRGHRRTYVGAMPGRVVQSLIDAGTANPVIMLDEIDKVGRDYRGDPSSALLEVLDPEQNSSFVDNYLDTPIDLSKVMFITTANVLDTIPPALRDRLEIIRFSGYTEQEKLFIAKNHLMDKQLVANGLLQKDISFPDKALLTLIKHYTNEAGVRSLEREMSKVMRKAARMVAMDGKRGSIKISEKRLEKFLGPKKYTHTIADEEDQVGTSTGLAYTQVGGDILFIEVALMEGKGDIKLTGQLGSVMKESAQAAVSYVRSNASKYKIDPAVFKKTDIHIHVPEGATPKDGPSAGAAITTAILSAFTKKKVDRLVGMTGEISLRGRVMEIGGVKEKVLAGHRAGLKQILLPLDNKKDLINVPIKVKKELKFHFAKNMDEVLAIALMKK